MPQVSAFVFRRMYGFRRWTEDVMRPLGSCSLIEITASIVDCGVYRCVGQLTLVDGSRP